ncbi:MAG: hypothetical protein ABFS14_08335 [Gemmatimonadota bacterium]
MLTRRALAVLILALWGGVLGWHAQRVLFPGELARLAEAARTLPPGAAYYALYLAGERAGWAQLDLDTLPGATGFKTTRRVVLELPGLGSAGVSDVRTEAWQGASLALDSLMVQRITQGDTVLTSFRALRSPEDPLFLDSTWPLRFAADGSARPGDRFAVDLYDPVQGVVRRLELSVAQQASRVWPDSADLDSLTGRWFSVREDTVQAWRVINAADGTEEELWIDENGRVLEGPLPGGIRMERTTFEIAFFNRNQPQGTSP